MNTDKNWFALEITVDSKSAEAIEFALNELDSMGTEINNLGKAKAESLCVVGYFNEKLASENVQNHLNEALRIYGFSGDAVKQVEWREVENTDWLIEWKKHWKPTETEKFIIAPSWENVESTDKIVVRIEPNMAFGTGTHETTRLCLRAIEENYRSEMSFLDVGTGTGILAIAVARFLIQSSTSKVSEPETKNYQPITGYDTDFDSIKIAGENAKANEVGDKIEFLVGSISEKDSKYGFVCANITIDVIIPILPLLIEKAEQFLVLSGVLKEQENSIVSELNKFQISNFQIETDGEWISIIIEKCKQKV